MTAPVKAHPAAWGLGLRSGGADLLRLTRGGDGAARVERCHSYDLPELWQAGAAHGELAAALNQIHPDEPLGICFPDRAVLYRALSLPSARPAVVQRMIEAQVDALLPTGGERLTWTSSASADSLHPGMQSVLLCAARRDLLEQVERLVPQGAAAQALLPRLVAMSYALRHSQPTTAAFQLLIDVCDDSVTMALATGGRVFRCVMLERDSAAKDGANKGAAGGWLLQLQPAYQSLVDALPAERLPRQGIVSSADDQEDLVATLETVLNVDLRRWSEALQPKLVSATALGAYGVAGLLLDGAAASNINFAKVNQPAAAAATVRPRRLLGIAAGCLLGVVVLYGLDCWRGQWLAGEVARLRGIETASGDLDRRLAINKYLEKHAPPALPMLDALLAAAPTSLQMTSVGVDAGNQLHFTGVLTNPSELDDFLHRLQRSPSLAHVELRSGRADPQQPQRWDVDLTAEAAPMAGLQLASNGNATASAGVHSGVGEPPPLQRRPTTAESTTRGRR
jgi:hypothetical protein